MRGKFNDLTGRRFGRLVVVERAERPARSRSTNAWWLCRCDCGETTVVVSDKLKDGRVRSCGCLRSELAKERMREIGRRNRKTVDSGQLTVDKEAKK